MTDVSEGRKISGQKVLHHKHYLEFTLAQEKVFYAIQSVTIAAHTRNEKGNILKDLLHFTLVVRFFVFYFTSY
jgi:hypothetical protein